MDFGGKKAAKNNAAQVDELPAPCPAPLHSLVPILLSSFADKDRRMGDRRMLN